MFINNSGQLVFSDELYHHGILGMHWGIRRFQPYPGNYHGNGRYVGKKTKYGSNSSGKVSLSSRIKNMTPEQKAKVKKYVKRALIAVGAAAIIGVGGHFAVQGFKAFRAARIAQAAERTAQALAEKEAFKQLMHDYIRRYWNILDMRDRHPRSEMAKKIANTAEKTYEVITKMDAGTRVAEKVYDAKVLEKIYREGSALDILKVEISKLMP